MTKRKVLARIDYLDNQIQSNPVDSESYQYASIELQHMILDKIGIREVDFFGKALERPLTNEEIADLIEAEEKGTPLNEAITLPANADAAYTIRLQRQHMNMTQKELAGKIGMRQSQLAKIESGQLNVSLNALQRAMAVFGKPYTIQPLRKGQFHISAK